MLLYASPEPAYREFWQQLDTAYFLRHEPDGDRLAYAPSCMPIRTPTPWSGRALTRQTRSRHALQVMVYVADQKELFSRICSFFESISFDIFEAKVHTTRHGFALDTFQIQDTSGRQGEYRDLISYIEYELTERLLNKHRCPADAAADSAASCGISRSPRKSTFRLTTRGTVLRAVDSCGRPARPAVANLRACY